MKINLVKPAMGMILLIGASTSLYLFYRHVYQDGPDICAAVFNSSCVSALSSDWSAMLGLPLGGWGLLYYLAILLLLLIPVFFGKTFENGITILLFIITLIAALAGIFLLLLMAVHPALFCPLCLIIHCCNLALFFLYVRIRRYGFSQFASSIKTGAKSFSLRKMAVPDALWMLTGFMVAALLLFAAFWGLKIVVFAAGDGSPISYKQLFSDYDHEPVKTIPVVAGDPLPPDTSGKMALVVFSDFYCPVCRDFSNRLEWVARNYPKDCYILFKQFPLSTDCNPAIKNDLHPGACEAARASLAAYRQGKFWQYHSALFKTQDLVKAAKNCDLQMVAFDAFRQSDTANVILQRNIREGLALGIEGTPAVFLNGRQIKDTRGRNVEVVIARELQKKQAP